MEPKIVVASCCPSLISTDHIIREILGGNELPEPQSLLQGIRAYPWHIDTKYYEANVLVCGMDNKTIGDQGFADSVEAVILCFDSSRSESLSIVEQWLTFTKEFSPEINILICERCSNSDMQLSARNQNLTPKGVDKVDAQKWCVENNFELVELNPLLDDEDEEDDFPESLGIKRVIQALHAHIWQNLKLKANPSRPKPNLGFPPVHCDFSEGGAGGESNGVPTSPTFAPERISDASKIAKVRPMFRQSLGGTEYPIPIQETVVVDDSLPTYEAAVLIETQNGIQQLNLGAEGPGPSNSTSTRRNPQASEKIDAMLEAMDALPEENFEALFQNLSAMRAKAESLSPTQRRAYAEQMTKAFWRSIKGDESEIAGLSSDEEVTDE